MKDNNIFVVNRFNKIIYLIICVIIFVAPFLFKTGIHKFANIPKDIFIQVSAATILCSHLIFQWIYNKKISIRLSSTAILIYLFAIYALIRSCLGTNSLGSIEQASKLVFPIIIFFLLTNLNIKNNKFSFLLLSVFISGTFASIIGIMQAKFGLNWIYQVVSPSITFGNKNMASQFIVMTIPLMWSLFFLYKNIFYRIVLFLCLIPQVYFLNLAKTKASILAICMVFLIILLLLTFNLISSKLRFLKSYNNLKLNTLFKNLIIKNTVIFFSSIILLIILASNFSEKSIPKIFNKYNYVFSYGTELIYKNDEERRGIIDNIRKYSTSAYVRNLIWFNSIEIIKDNPVWGVGPGNFKVYYPYYKNKFYTDRSFNFKSQAKNVHNDYIQFFVEYGVVGYIFVLLVIYSILYKGVDIRRHNVIQGILLSIFAIFFNAGFSFPFQKEIIPLIFFALLAVIDRSSAKKIDDIVIEIKSKAINYSLIVSSLVFSCLVIKHKADEYEYDKKYFRLMGLEKGKNWNRLLSESLRFIDSYKWRPLVYGFIGKVYILKKDYKNSEKYLSELREIRPYSVSPMYNLAASFLMNKKYARAVEIYNDLLVINPSDPRLHKGIGLSLYHLRNMKRAKKHLKHLVKKNDMKSIQYLALIDIQNKNYNSAVKYLLRLSKTSSKWFWPYKTLGTIYYYIKKNKEKGLYYFKLAKKYNQRVIIPQKKP